MCFHVLLRGTRLISHTNSSDLLLLNIPADADYAEEALKYDVGAETIVVTLRRLLPSAHKRTHQGVAPPIDLFAIASNHA